MIIFKKGSSAYQLVIYKDYTRNMFYGEELTLTGPNIREGYKEIAEWGETMIKSGYSLHSFEINISEPFFKKRLLKRWTIEAI